VLEGRQVGPRWCHLMGHVGVSGQPLGIHTDDGVYRLD